MLEVTAVGYSYGRIEALSGVSLAVKEGTITALLGPNGAGKSTLVNTIAGLLIPSSGDIFFRGERITKLPPHERVKRGISVVPERRRLFQNLSLLENLKAGASSNMRDFEDNFDAIASLFPILKQRRKAIVSTMSGGQQQVVAVARGLMANPKVLILDEPLLGLQPSIVQEMIQNFKRIAELGTSIMLVEQNFFQVSKIMDWAYIIEHGRVTLGGSAEEITTNPEVKRVYIGL